MVEFGEDNLVKARRLKQSISSFCDNTIEEILRKYCLETFKIHIPPIWYDKRNPKYYNKLMGEGVSCKLLKLGSKNLQSGRLKIRLNLEFEPDEPEIKEPLSPLDDIRQSINQ